MASKVYCGIDKDIQGGMTATGKIIRDAWVFGLIPETETCEGWLAQGIEALWEKVGVEWDRYGYSVSALPDEMRETYLRVQKEAIERARAAGWKGEQELAADD